MKSSSFSSNNLSPTALAIFLMSILISISAFPSQSLENPLLPSDGESVTVQPIEPFYPEVNGYWDFSNASYQSAPFDIRFSYENDSILSATLPGIRYDFEVKGDTIVHTATETHFVKITYTTPIPYAILNEKSFASLPFSSKGRAYHSKYFASQGIVSMHTLGSGNLILSSCDTIPDIKLIFRECIQSIAPNLADSTSTYTDSITPRIIRRTASYAWVSDEYCVPLAMVNEISDSTVNVKGCKTTTSAWLCPPGNQNIKHLIARSGRLKPTPSNQPGYNIFKELLAVSLSDGDISVSGTAVSDCNISMTISDNLGRIHAKMPQTYYKSGAPIEWSCKGLNPGYYILTVNSDGSPVTSQKITVR